MKFSSFHVLLVYLAVYQKSLVIGCDNSRCDFTTQPANCDCCTSGSECESPYQIKSTTPSVKSNAKPIVPTTTPKSSTKNPPVHETNVAINLINDIETTNDVKVPIGISLINKNVMIHLSSIFKNVNTCGERKCVTSTTMQPPTTTRRPTTLSPTTLPPTTTRRPATLPPTTTRRPTTLPPTTTRRPTTLPPTTTRRPTTLSTTTRRSTTLPPTTTRRPTILSTTTRRPTTLPPTTTKRPTTLRPTTTRPTTSRSTVVTRVIEEISEESTDSPDGSFPFPFGPQQVVPRPPCCVPSSPQYNQWHNLGYNQGRGTPHNYLQGFGYGWPYDQLQRNGYGQAAQEPYNQLEGAGYGQWQGIPYNELGGWQYLRPVMSPYNQLQSPFYNALLRSS